MKKTLLTIIIGFFFISCGIKKKTPTESEYQIGWYFEIEKNETFFVVKDFFLDKVYYLQAEPILTISDFKSMKIKMPNWGGEERIMIEVELNEDVKEKWGDFTERMSKTREKVHFVYKNEVISTLSAFQRLDNGYTMIAHEKLTEEMSIEIMKTIRNKSE